MRIGSLPSCSRTHAASQSVSTGQTRANNAILPLAFDGSGTVAVTRFNVVVPPEGPDFEGQIRRLRAGDGVHFTRAGARKLAHYVEREIRRVMLARATPATAPLLDAVKDKKTRQPYQPVGEVGEVGLQLAGGRVERGESLVAGRVEEGER